MLKRLSIPLLLVCLLMLVLPQAASAKHIRVFAGVGPVYTYSAPYYGYYGFPAFEGYPQYYYYRPYYYRSYPWAPYYYPGGYGWGWRWHH
jgi:hypothetical protein